MDNDPMTTTVVQKPALEQIQDKMINATYINIGQDLIITTDLKVRPVLENGLRQAGRNREWFAPAGMLMTLVGSLVNSTFRDLVLSKYTWEALYVLLAIVCFGWLIKSAIDAWNCPSKDELISNMLRDLTQEVIVQEQLQVTLVPTSKNYPDSTVRRQADNKTDEVM